jgi:uncharacterized protein (TIGR02001 family)
MLSSNELFRGQTISNDAPTASLAVSFDHRSGLFAGGAASLTATDGGPRLAYANQYAGYAARLGQVSVEAGVIHRSYDRVVDNEYRRGFFEGYAGITHKSIKARIHVSPDYRRDRRVSYYGELNARLLALGRWNLEGHAGLSVIAQPDGTGRAPMRPFGDWRLQIGRPIGPLFLTAGIGATAYPVYSANGGVRPFLSISHVF